MAGLKQLAIVLVSSLGLASCAHHAGSAAAEGAVAELARKPPAGAGQEERPVETIAGAAVDGAIAHVGSPEQLATLERTVSRLAGVAADAATERATERMLSGLARQLGQDGRGELGRSVAAAAALAAADTTDGILRRVLPDCGAGDTRCLDRRLEEMSRHAGVGLVRGIKEPLGLLPLVLSFIAGLMVASLLRLLRRGRPRPGEIEMDHRVDSGPTPALR